MPMATISAWEGFSVAGNRRGTLLLGGQPRCSSVRGDRHPLHARQALADQLQPLEAAVLVVRGSGEGLVTVHHRERHVGVGREEAARMVRLQLALGLADVLLTFEQCPGLGQGLLRRGPSGHRVDQGVVHGDPDHAHLRAVAHGHRVLELIAEDLINPNDLVIGWIGIILILQCPMKIIIQYGHS